MYLIYIYTCINIHMHIYETHVSTYKYMPICTWGFVCPLYLLLFLLWWQNNQQKWYKTERLTFGYSLRGHHPSQWGRHVGRSRPCCICSQETEAYPFSCAACFLLFLNPEPQPMEWCHAHLAWVFWFQFTWLRPPLTGMARDLFPGQLCILSDW